MPLAACRSALIQSFIRSAPQTVLDEKGYVSEAGQNLIEEVRLVDFEIDLRQGDGNEMEESVVPLTRPPPWLSAPPLPSSPTRLLCGSRGAVTSPV